MAQAGFEVTWVAALAVVGLGGAADGRIDVAAEDVHEGMMLAGVLFGRHTALQVVGGSSTSLQDGFEYRPRRRETSDKEGDPLLGHGGDDHRRDFIADTGGVVEAVELRGFDAGAGCGEDAETHEYAEADLDAELHLKLPDNGDRVESERDVADGGVCCGRFLVIRSRNR